MHSEDSDCLQVDYAVGCRRIDILHGGDPLTSQSWRVFNVLFHSIPP